MESIKYKMDTLINEKIEAEGRVVQLRKEKETFDAEATRYEKEIIEGEKKMLIFEDEFDKATTEYNEDQEKLESLSKTQNDAELQLGALKRRKQLIEEELERCEKRAAEAVEQMARVESSCEEDNRARKIAEVRSQEAEDRIDSMENQLQEAQELAQTANHKYEEVERRLRMVQNELERALEKADDYETSTSRLEQNIKESTEKLKEMEIQSQCNGQQEDDYEEQEKKLRKYFSF